MLMKSTPGLNVINVLHTAFTYVDPKCAKKDSQVKSAVSFGAFGTYERKMLMKSTPGICKARESSEAFSRQKDFEFDQSTFDRLDI